MTNDDVHIVQIPFLSVCHISKHFAVNGMFKNKNVSVLQDVCFELERGESLGIVGESGSGKTTLAKVLAGYHAPDSGCIQYDGVDPSSLSRRAWQMKRRDIQMIFQNHAQALNPRQTIGSCIKEALASCDIEHTGTPNLDFEELMSVVGLASELLNRYPAELSSGQRQRATIARALAVHPTILIADEPTSNLDARLRRRIINLLAKLKERFHLTLVLISHDINMVTEAVDRIVVLYRGKVVETGNTELLLKAPRHPYTRMLFSAARDISTSVGSAVSGNMPKPLSGNEGCVFAERCTYADDDCTGQTPALNACACGHSVACVHSERLCGSIF